MNDTRNHDRKSPAKTQVSRLTPYAYSLGHIWFSSLQKRVSSTIKPSILLVFDIAVMVTTKPVLGPVLPRRTSVPNAPFYPYGDVGDQRVDDFPIRWLVIKLVCPNLSVPTAHSIILGKFPVRFAAFELFQSRFHW